MATIKAAAAALKNAKNIVALTGAGISVESGVPAFRTDKDGLWKRFDMSLVSLTRFKRDPEGFWRGIKPMRGVFFGAKPNAAHVALAELEADGKLSAIITQNVDGLHQEAGSKRVIEFHGNLRRLRCLKCNKTYELMSFAESIERDEIPRCGCGTVLKPDATFFDEGIPSKAHRDALKVLAKCDACLIIGTSGLIAPANTLPDEAKKAGAVLIEINPLPSFLTLKVDMTVLGKAGEVLPKLRKAA